MDNQYFTASGVLVINALFGLYILAVLLRFLLQWAGADFYNPLCQFLVKVTNPPLKPLRRIIPGWGGIDLASVLLLVALQMLEVFLVNTTLGRAAAPGGLFVGALAELINLTLNVYIVMILIQVILSWLAPGNYNPMTALLHQLTEPVLAPARRVMPAISGIDLSPIVVLLFFQLLKLLIVAPLADFGRSLS